MHTHRCLPLFGTVTTVVMQSLESLFCRYAVIPLSPNSGLIGWVPNTDTLHALIREYREARKIPLNVEHRLMMGMAPDHDHLTVIQKVEVFEHALESTTGEDLHKVCEAATFLPTLPRTRQMKCVGHMLPSANQWVRVPLQVLWLKSRSSEVWLERRTSYTRSTGVMSMVRIHCALCPLCGCLTVARVASRPPGQHSELQGVLSYMTVGTGLHRWATCWAWVTGTPAI